jgi:hypothetical protein
MGRNWCGWRPACTASIVASSHEILSRPPLLNSLFGGGGAAVPKTKPIPEAVRRRAVAAVAAAWESGCPVADWRPEGQAAIADVCLRRYSSLARRGVGAGDRAGQVRDLARGLVEASGQDRALVGPLIRDYQWLAEQVLAAITAEEEGKEDAARFARESRPNKSLQQTGHATDGLLE